MASFAATAGRPEPRAGGLQAAGRPSGSARRPNW